MKLLLKNHLVGEDDNEEEYEYEYDAAGTTNANGKDVANGRSKWEVVVVE